MLREELNEYSIFALREIARNVGVKSPTSKKKEELIEGVIAIKEGRLQPVKISKQGRPPKNFSSDLSNLHGLKQTTIPIYSSAIELNQNVMHYEKSNEVVTSLGYVELLNSNVAFLHVKNNELSASYYLPSCFVSDLMLRTGDKVLAEIGVVENSMQVKSVFNVNDCPINKLPKSRTEYDSVAHKITNEQIPVSGNKGLGIKFGENVFLVGNDNNENTLAVANLLNSFDVENKIYLNISIVEKNKILLKNFENVEMFVSCLTDETESVKRNVALAIERAKRLLENGQNVVVAVDDLLSVYDLDSMLAKKLIALTKNSKNGSITQLVVYDEKLQFAKKLADKNFKIVSESEFESL